jgi:NTP pyrophosphatase (non-canonical NTP hydrolase)
MAEIEYEQRRKLYERALRLKGIENQLDITIEECAELIQALIKLKRTHDKYDVEVIKEHLAEELADNQIMAEQLVISFGTEFAEQIINHKNNKLNRLRKRLDVLESEVEK